MERQHNDRMMAQGQARRGGGVEGGGDEGKKVDEFYFPLDFPFSLAGGRPWGFLPPALSFALPLLANRG